MKTRMYATAAFVSIVLAGCTQQEEPGANAPSMEGMPIRVTTQVTKPETRQEMETKDLTEFYFRVTDAGGTTTHYNYFARMTKQDDGSWTTEDGSAEWKAATAQVSAVAQKTANGWTTWTDTDYDNGKEVEVLADQSGDDDANVKASDLLYMHAAEIDPTNVKPEDPIKDGKVVVTMNHAFAKLEVTVTLTGDAAEAESNPITELKVGGTRLKAKFTPAADTPLDLEQTTSDNAATDITPYQIEYTPKSTTSLIAPSTASYECIIVPQKVEADLFKVTATLGGTDYTYTHTSAIDFTANKKYTLALTITSSSKMEIDGGGVSVGGWDEGTEDLNPGGSEMAEPLTLDLKQYTDLNSNDLKEALIAAANNGQTDWVLTGEIGRLPNKNAVKAALKAIETATPNKRITISIPGVTKGEDGDPGVGAEAFSECKALTSISLSQATGIGTEAFSGCSNLTDVDLPKVEKINYKAFTECTSLKSISLPSAQMIGNTLEANSAAFNNCTSLKRVELPAATTILRSAFSNCTALETLIFGTVITEWGKEVFYGLSPEQIAKIALTLNGEQTDDDDVAIFDEQGNAQTNVFKSYTFKSITKYTAPTE